MQNRQKGFTLIELMIAIAIIGILSAIAVPSYGKYVREARRTDGHIALQTAAQEMERCRTQTFTYLLCTPSQIASGSADNHYTIEFDTTVTRTANAYQLKAVPAVGGTQANDTACNAMTINAVGTTGPTACW